MGAATKSISTKPSRALVYVIATLIFCWATFLLVDIFRGAFYVVFSASTYLTIHDIAEFFSIIVSFSIFGFGWFTYRLSKNNYMLFLAIIFLGIGALDFMHALSFPGTPTFITPSSTDKGIQYWLAARLLAAVGFLVGAFMASVQGKKLPKNAMLLGMLALTAGYFVWVSFFPHSLPVYFVPGKGLTHLKVVIEYIIIIISTVALFFYYLRFRKSQDQALVWIMCALVFSIFGELAFTLYKSAYDTFNLLGHVYKVIAFVLIYRGVFIASTATSYEQLAQSEEEFSTAFINSPNLMAITEPETGKIVEINNAFCQFFGYERNEMVGHTTAEFKMWAVPSQRDKLLTQLKKSGSVHNADVLLRVKSGEVRPVIDSLDYVNVGDKKYMLSVALDISDRKRAELALRKSEQHIKELSEVRQKFIEVISHQLRTPLGSIRWNLQSLLDGSLGKLTEAQRQFLALTYQADVELIDRANDLFSALDIEEGKITFDKSDIAIDSLLGSVMIGVRQRCEEKGITLEYHEPKEPLPLLKVDATKIRTVYEKLLGNAIVFTPKKGKIEVSLVQADRHVRFEVRDTGIGIPKAEQRHIFTSFYRGSNAFRAEPNASGVGLTIAKHYIERQGGTIGFTSKEGKGSTFWFELPAH
ncbi:MAG TPA: MASE3 domain-containing protein [Candidatus Saccharimonadales bacterium]